MYQRLKSRAKEYSKPSPFDSARFASHKFRVDLLLFPWPLSGSWFCQWRDSIERPLPSPETIQRFLSNMFGRLGMSTECAIIALIYIDRLDDCKAVPLSRANWRCLVIVALLVASKVCDDLSLFNIEISTLFPFLSLKVLKDLELQFLQHLGWNLHVSGSLYAHYYFALRSLRLQQQSPSIDSESKEEAHRSMPKLYEKLNITGARRVELRLAAREEVAASSM
jgi:hypothetical protein